MSTTGTARKRERSPNYPGLSLDVALGRAKTLLQKEGRNAAPVSAIFKHWDYGEKSSSAMIAIAALKSFGLVEYEGSGADRHARLTPLALSILLDERQESPERAAAIQKAALAPKLFADLWREYAGELPSDDNLRYQLRAKRGFTDGAASDVIRKFKATLTFAGLTGPGSLSTDGSSPDDEEIEDVGIDLAEDIPSEERPRVRRKKPGMLTYPLAIAPGVEVTIEGQFPLTDAQWAQMLRVLDVMKPGLVADPDDSEDE